MARSFPPARFRAGRLGESIPLGELNTDLGSNILEMLPGNGGM